MTSTEPVFDVVGPADMAAVTHPITRSVSELADRLLAPTAQKSDQGGLPRTHLQALAAVGALGLQFPVEVGGGGAPVAVVREVTELIAGACGTTWFCWAQHKAPTGILLASDSTTLRDRWLQPLVTGQILGSIAFAHLRRAQQTFFATKVADGWELDGRLDWVTSWPISDVTVVQAAVVGDHGEPSNVVVSVVVEPPRPDPSMAPGLSAGPSLPLAAMGGTHTWPVRFGGYRVKDSDVCCIETIADWTARNSHLSADANPASFGMARAGVNELAALGKRTGQASAIDAADRLADEIRDVRQRSYTLTDESLFDGVSVSDSQAEQTELAARTELRAMALELNLRVATALVAASGGGAMSLWASPQRRAREALFLLVQGQTGQLRSATLRRATRTGLIGT